MAPSFLKRSSALYDAARGETFTAVRDTCARLNGAEISVNDPVDLPQALVATGFAYAAQARVRQAATIVRILPRVRDIRSAGSAALDLCWVAAGRCDAYYEDELSRWDWAAGALIVDRAGGIATAFGTGVAAAGPALHQSLCPLLAGGLSPGRSTDLGLTS